MEGHGGRLAALSRHSLVALSLLTLISGTLAFLAYVVFVPVPGGGAGSGGLMYQWRRCQDSAGRSDGDDGGTMAGGVARAPTSLSHIVFGIGGAARTWGHRRGYVELWWRPGRTRGHVWLDEEPAGPWPAATSPPYRVSADASRFGRRAAASRMARIVADSFAAVAAANGTGEEEVRWFVMGDDDTVFFPDNLVAVLRKYDHEQAYYVGAPSESVAQDLTHSYGMAFGGGGFAVSYPAAAELAGAIDGCLDRYRELFGSDERVHACLSELGIPLTREPGFHQLDLRGDAYGLLSAHPVAPLVSLHHLDLIEPISPHGRTALDAVRSLVDAAQLDPARSLQQAFCYHNDSGGSEGSNNWSVSVAWGYAAQLYPWAVPAHQLEVPLQTFEALRGRPDGPFLFNTRPWRPDDACARPLTFFLSHARNETYGATAAAATVTEYSRHAGGKSMEKECDKPSLRSAAAVQTVRVLAPKMNPADWERAPRRQCCKTAWARRGSVLEVRIGRCRRGELAVVSSP
ncbi:hypothetical protein SETIT_5G066700v2 [Setaria italica]|uniref:Fringe-related protein n=1 Tax=Setaria italica TaxID=4555 RepID=K3XGP7_SETIT|nr:uncharacterized protein LOC101761114 [Setaria italica]RCV24210.1 hypothetical protein SETIT_5G066700v2 [Setaria italica]